MVQIWGDAPLRNREGQRLLSYIETWWEQGTGAENKTYCPLIVLGGNVCLCPLKLTELFKKPRVTYTTAECIMPSKGLVLSRHLTKLTSSRMLLCHGASRGLGNVFPGNSICLTSQMQCSGCSKSLNILGLKWGDSVRCVHFSLPKWLRIINWSLNA